MQFQEKGFFIRSSNVLQDIKEPKAASGSRQPPHLNKVKAQLIDTTFFTCIDFCNAGSGWQIVVLSKLCISHVIASGSLLLVQGQTSYSPSTTIFTSWHCSSAVPSL